MPVKKPVARKSCTCFAQVQKELREFNTTLRQELLFNFDTKVASRSTRPMLVTEKIDSSKKKPPKKEIFCAYCPFCGKKYVK